MSEKSLEAILGDFKPVAGAQGNQSTERRAVTIWLLPEEKARYDRLQQISKSSNRRFSEIAREALRTLIALAEAKAS